MKKKIAIIGSTGSIGKNLLDIISNDINDFKINLLTADKDHKTLLRQAKKFNVTNLIIKNGDELKFVYPQSNFEPQQFENFLLDFLYLLN